MHQKSPLRSKSKVAHFPVHRLPVFKALLATGAVALACAAITPRADANAALCAAGAECGSDIPNAPDARRSWRYSTALQRTSADRSLRRVELSDQDYSAFSGVGVIVCFAEGRSRASTAFLVGAFDIGVTVAHTFAKGADGAEPECMYNTMDSQGQIRERSRSPT